MRSFVTGLLMLLLPLSICSVSAESWYILPDGTGDAPTIEAAIDSAGFGDTLVLGCGTFYESDIVIDGSVLGWLAIESETGNPDCVTIDAQQSGRVFHCSNTDVRFRGLTIQNGLAADGGGIHATDSEIYCYDCVFTSNQASGSGGGFYGVDTAEPRIAVYGLLNCSFTGNQANTGGGAYLDGGDNAGLHDCSFTSNTAQWSGGCSVWADYVSVARSSFAGNSGIQGRGGLSAAGHYRVIVGNCLFIENTTGGKAGGLWVDGAFFETTISHCTFDSNQSAEGGSGIHSFNSVSTQIRKCIVTSGIGGEAVGVEYGDVAWIECTDIYGNEGGDWVGGAAGHDSVFNNFSADPLFCDAAGDDFTLHSNSPCADGNHPDGASCGTIGARDVGCGPTTSVEQTNWGEVKGLFR